MAAAASVLSVLSVVRIRKKSMATDTIPTAADVEFATDVVGEINKYDFVTRRPAYSRPAKV